MNPSPGHSNGMQIIPFSFSLTNTLHVHRHCLPILHRWGVVMSLVVRHMVDKVTHPLAQMPSDDELTMVLHASATAAELSRDLPEQERILLVSFLQTMFTHFQQQWLTCIASNPNHYLSRIDFGFFNGTDLSVSVQYWSDRSGSSSEIAPLPRLAQFARRHH